MPFVFHYYPLSAPSRAIFLTIKALGIECDVKKINSLEKELLSIEFIKMNPLKPTTVPEYLCDVYAKDDSLFPKDVEKREIVIQRLCLDFCLLYPRIRKICFPAIFDGETIVSDDKKKQLEFAFQMLDGFLDGNDYACGKALTIADIALVASVSSIKAVGWNCAKYKNIENWLKKCAKNIPGYNENEKGAEKFGNLVKSKLAPGQF